MYDNRPSFSRPACTILWCRGGSHTWEPFALASGALGVSRSRFLVVFGAARTLRYSLIAWLGVVYGDHLIRLWSATLQKWSAPLLWVFAGLMVVGACFAIWKIRGLLKSDAALEHASHAEAVLTD